jgi:hypothetical protein
MENQPLLLIAPAPVLPPVMPVIAGAVAALAGVSTNAVCWPLWNPVPTICPELLIPAA